MPLNHLLLFLAHIDVHAMAGKFSSNQHLEKIRNFFVHRKFCQHDPTFCREIFFSSSSDSAFFFPSPFPRAFSFLLQRRKSTTTRWCLGCQDLPGPSTSQNLGRAGWAGGKGFRPTGAVADAVGGQDKMLSRVVCGVHEGVGVISLGFHLQAVPCGDPARRLAEASQARPTRPNPIVSYRLDLATRGLIQPSRPG